MEMSPAELVVLGLVAEHPRHGYDLDRTIEERGIRQWTDVASSSVYYLLGRLEQRGLVRSEKDGAARSRRTYSVTDDGRTAAASAVAELLADASPTPNRYLVALANLDLVGPDRTRTLAQDRAEDLDRRTGAVRAARDGQGDLPLAARLVFSHTLTMLTAERDWLRRVAAGEEPQ